MISKDPYVMILNIVSWAWLAKKIKEAKIITKYWKLWFDNNNIYIWKAWKTKIPSKYYKIIEGFYREHIKDHTKITNEIDSLLKKHLKSEKK